MLTFLLAATLSLSHPGDTTFKGRPEQMVMTNDKELKYLGDGWVLVDFISAEDVYDSEITLRINRKNMVTFCTGQLKKGQRFTRKIKII